MGVSLCPNTSAAENANVKSAVATGRVTKKSKTKKGLKVESVEENSGDAADNEHAPTPTDSMDLLFDRGVSDDFYMPDNDLTF